MRSGRSEKYWRAVHTYLADVIEEDSALRRTSLVVNFDELCSQPRQVLKWLYHRAGLSADHSLIEKQSCRVRAPSYYTPDFSKNDLRFIQAETADVYNRMLRLVLKQ